LNNISDRSLVLFLERGTSTYDGISIAWAVLQFLRANFNALPCNLDKWMSESLPRIQNYNVCQRIKRYRAFLFEN
jgi:hypothetical protein